MNFSISFFFFFHKLLLCVLEGGALLKNMFFPWLKVKMDMLFQLTDNSPGRDVKSHLTQDIQVKMETCQG